MLTEKEIADTKAELMRKIERAGLPTRNLVVKFSQIQKFSHDLLDVVILGYIWTESEPLAEQNVLYPADWWQAVKERWVPDFIRRYFPVKYEGVRLSAWAYYPNLEYDPPHRLRHYVDAYFPPEGTNLTRRKFVVHVIFGQEWVTEDLAQFSYDNVVIDLRSFLLQDNKGYTEVSYPSSWVEYLKERWFPGWAKDKWSVKMKKVFMSANINDYPDFWPTLPDEECRVMIDKEAISK